MGTLKTPPLNLVLRTYFALRAEFGTRLKPAQCFQLAIFDCQPVRKQKRANSDRRMK